MTEFLRSRRKQILREAEGYLDLATACVDRFGLQLATRDRMAERALETLQRLDHNGQRRVEAFYLQGQAYRVMERYADAIVALDQAAELEHDNIHVWLALGWCQKRTGRLDKAIEALEEALQINDRQAIVHYNLACYWSLVRNVKFAVRFLEQAFELDPAFRELVADEHDFDPIREHPRFQELMSVIV
jgi:tetratricopeptide (TPR) repeat protein